MIKFSKVSQCDYNSIGFMVKGDGQSTVLVIRLDVAPFNLTFSKKAPVEFDVHLSLDKYTATAAVDALTGNTLTVTFATAMADGEEVTINILPVYASL